MVILYGHPFSTFVQRVRIALAEKGVNWEEKFVDMANREHREDAYKAINPYGRVPSIDDNGFKLYESTAILGYLEALHPEPALLPKDVKGRAAVEMHVKLCDLQFTRHVSPIIFPKRFLPENRWDEELFAKRREHIVRHLGILNQQLRGTDYLAGDMFSLAEISYAPFLPYLVTCDVEPPPEVERWGRAIMERPSVESTRPPDAPRW